MQNAAFVLPIAVVSPMDVSRLVRELKNLDEYFAQHTIRDGQAPEMPRYSRLLDAIVVTNKLDLVDSQGRANLLQQFEVLQAGVPVMHISFSTDPPGSYVQKIVAWLRENIHPHVLVRVGLQPNIGAGCIVRTTNKAFDFSLRQYFDTKHDFFRSKLHEVVSENIAEPAVATVTAEAPAPGAAQQPAPAATVEQVSEPAATPSPQPEDATEAPVAVAQTETPEQTSTQTVPVEVQS